MADSYETGTRYWFRNDCPCGLLDWEKEYGWHAHLHEGCQMWHGTYCPSCHCFLHVTHEGTPVVGWPGVRLDTIPGGTPGSIILVESTAHVIDARQQVKHAREDGNTRDA